MDTATIWNQLPALLATADGRWAAIAACVLAAAGIATLVTLLRRMTGAGRTAELAARLDSAEQRLVGAEVLLADSTAEVAVLRQRLDQLQARQDSQTSSNARSGFRQAIVLSKHGASVRQLIDTCGLSHGEAHLIHSIYGQSGSGQALPAGAGDELH